MKKQLLLNGNSWVLYINKTIADFMGIDKEDKKVGLTYKNKVLYVKKIVNDENNDIVKNLIKRGSGFGLILSYTILGLLEINPETDFIDIDLEEKILLVRKACSS